MKTWQKITLILTTLLLAAGLLYLYNQTSSDPNEESGSQQNPVFPFSSTGDQDGSFFNQDGDTTTPNDSDRGVQEDEQLWQISEKPVAGSQWVNTGNGNTSLWYAHRENGHVYSHDPESRTSKRLTNTTIPRLQEALFSPSGDFVIYRYIDNDTGNVKTYVAELQETNEGDIPYEVSGSFLPDNVTAVSLSPDGSRVFSLQHTSNDSVGVVNSLGSSEGELVFQSPVREWRSQWTNNNEITLFTKPADRVEGVALRVPSSGQQQTDKITDGINLTVKADSVGEYILVSKEEGGNYRTFVYEETDLSSSIMIIPTVSEKCSWQPDGTVFFCGVPQESSDFQLKHWYQGRVSYADDLVQFDATDRDQDDLFSEISLQKGPFDITNITVSQDSSYLGFQDKSTGSLWGFDL